MNAILLLATSIVLATGSLAAGVYIGITVTEDTSSEDREDLAEENEQLRQHTDRLTDRNEQLSERNDNLETRVEELEERLEDPSAEASASPAIYGSGDEVRVSGCELQVEVDDWGAEDRFYANYDDGISDVIVREWGEDDWTRIVEPGEEIRIYTEDGETLVEGKVVMDGEEYVDGGWTDRPDEITCTLTDEANLR
ncbi:hypothetical protein [Natrarchaeobaculum sulfurireducens]|uniref:Uncharacterized protein n=1 Tax=Natrarchaeobaculum sulfurireducens TaxID=2044521 RepID=A0A346PQK5_9EURY|nr:hypothetical protein [Natrarchaeobaculum sulfurireducens]AXR81800.1 hypothetical protein AArcMg_1792 [Natrarchaeobaculum sulfurireducens]